MVSIVTGFIKDPSGSLMGISFKLLSQQHIYLKRDFTFFLQKEKNDLFSKEKSRRVRESMKFIVEEKDLYFLSLFFFLKFNQTLVCIDDTRSNCIVVVEV